MLEIKRTATYTKWEAKLKDKKVKAIIATCVFRLANGLAGDVKSVGDGISEIRIHYSSGYRVYFKQEGGKIIILLCGGDKSSQNLDIDKAKQLAKEMRYEDG